MRRLAAGLLALLILAQTVPAGAEVSQQELADARAKAQAVADELQAELILLDQAQVAQAGFESRIAAIEADVTDRVRRLALVEFAARERAVSMYVNAGTSQAQTVLDIESISDRDTRNAYLGAVVDSDRNIVNELEFLQADRLALQTELDSLKEEQVGVQADLDQTAAIIMARLEEANDEFQVLYDQWWREEQERIRIAEEERKRAAAAAAASAAAAAGYTSSAGIPPGGRTCPFIGPSSFRDSWGEPRPGGRTHTGLDMVAPNGVPLVSIETGTIWSPNWHYAGGLGLYIRGDSGDVYYYAHMSAYAPGISDGVRVGAGQIVGYNGATGNAAVPHLHLGYRPGGGPLTNPYQLMVKLCR